MHDPLEEILARLPEPHANRQVGRNDAQLAVLFRALAIGHTMTTAAALAGLSTNSVKRWRKSDSRFRVRFDEARKAGQEALARRRIQTGMTA